MEIKRVIICGLGAIGLTYANKLKDVCELKILADSKRIESYKNDCPKLNGKEIELNYITPDEAQSADLIIISTKNDGLKSAINYIKNFIVKDTIILSLLNGITSEKEISEVYGKDKVLHSYFIGHSAMREGNSVIQDGVGKIFFGSPYEENLEKVKILKNFFESKNIDYEIPQDIIYSLWLKFTMNVFANQLSAVLGLKFGDMQGSDFENLAKNIISEVVQIAKCEGVSNAERLEKDSLDSLKLMIPEGKTSMLQDIEGGRKTEVDIFAGEVIRLGEKYGIPTPYNKILYEMIKVLENRGY